MTKKKLDAYVRQVTEIAFQIVYMDERKELHSDFVRNASKYNIISKREWEKRHGQEKSKARLCKDDSMVR